jgi:ribonucleoside-diphosphate reductase alpha chain
MTIATSVSKLAKNGFTGRLDPKHQSFPLFDHPLSLTIWHDKYRYKDEKNPGETFWRVAKAICGEDNDDFAAACYHAMTAGLWMPGGRILAGAGTSKNVTLMNCYVNRTMEDSMQSIMDANKDNAITLQAGGGMGTNFSTLRPQGAEVRGVGSRASGPLPFMDMWDSTSDTVMSAGHRRGAMMGTLCDTHPDLPAFIKAKQTKDRLTNFNVSVLISDAFMEAVRENEEWVLYFNVPPAEREASLEEYDFTDDETHEKQYAYSVHKAKDLWALITKNTYEFSEPGVIFIDRVNDLNNLKYCEDIQCTNPCGEQPLPPNGTCNLGAINLARLVRTPYEETATFDYELLGELAALGVRFLDNVIEQTKYPLKAQQEEELAKRRIGLGVSGLADALAQLGLRYGSPAAREVTDKIFYTICQAAYETSINLARERGSFPLFKTAEFQGGFAGRKLDHVVLAELQQYGIRNGVLLTVAPTGTTSIFYGDISSGIEPVFAHTYKRKVRRNEGEPEIMDTQSFSSRFYAHCMQNSLGAILRSATTGLPGYFVTVDDLTIEDHVTMLAAVQNWIDASVTKTVNVAKDTSYEGFVKVYDLAYTLGCKGCTTYRPSDVRGSILLAAADAPKDNMPLTRPDQLFGITRKIKWPTLGSSLYLTVNFDALGNPFEVFIHSKDARSHEWIMSTSLMLTALLRQTKGNAGFIAKELQEVQSLHDTAFVKGPNDTQPKRYGSIVAYLGAHLADILSTRQSQSVSETAQAVLPSAEMCPQCHSLTLIRKEGCKTCSSCGHSDCG